LPCHVDPIHDVIHDVDDDDDDDDNGNDDDDDDDDDDDNGNDDESGPSGKDELHSLIHAVDYEVMI